MAKVYRALQSQTDLSQVMQVGGGDVALSVPSHLLPHHEHLLPPAQPENDAEKHDTHMDKALSTPNTLQREQHMEQIEPGMTSITVSGRANLPAKFEQQLLDFLAALVKATKIIEIEKDPGAFDEEIHGIKEFSKAVNDSIKDKFKKTSVNVAVSDAWIAKLVGKALRSLETVRGDLGYSQSIPIPLKPYWDKAETGSKLLG